MNIMVILLFFVYSLYDAGSNSIFTACCRLHYPCSLVADFLFKSPTLGVNFQLFPKQMSKYCMNLTRRFDNENYLVSLFSPPKCRNAVWAIRAFNVETCQIHENTKDSLIGKMRIQWWREMIDSTFDGKPLEHPISNEISSALKSSKLSKLWFKRILKERENHLDRKQFGTLNDLEQYAENGTSSLLFLQMESLGIHNHAVEHALGHIGKAAGICNILRGFRFDLENRKVLLPSELMAKVILG
jgi:NADH dehydrogenase [ubiquinone] 1 alpha subcomplex assembly factor 6